MSFLPNIIVKSNSTAGTANALMAFTGTDNLLTDSSTPTFTGGVLSGLSTPVSDTDAANKAYVDSVAQGLGTIESVRLSTTAAGTLASDFEDGDSIDGSALVTGDRILIKDQVSAIENGVYVVVASGAPTRASDMAEDGYAAGKFTFVEEGTANADTGWVCISDGGSDVVGTDSLDFTQFNATATFSGGEGIDISSGIVTVDFTDTETMNIGTGNDLQVAHNGNATITNSTGNIDISTSGVLTLNGTTSTSISGDASNDTELLLKSDGSISIQAGDGTQALHIGLDQQVMIGDGQTLGAWTPTVAGAADSNIQIGGSFSTSGFATSAATVNLGDDDSVLLADASSFIVTVNLPVAATVGAGRRYDIKVIDGTFSTNVTPDASDKIDDLADGVALSLVTTYESLSLISDGTDWKVL